MNIRTITRHMLHYRYNMKSKAWEHVSEQTDVLGHDKLWLDDILAFYNSRYVRPLLKGYDNIYIYIL